MSVRSRTRALLAGATTVATLALALLSGAPAAQAAPPGPAGVTKADELAYLRSLTGNHVLSGQQGGANSDPAYWTARVHDITGEYPAVWNGDFGFSQNDIDNRQKVVDQAKTEWNNGSLPGLMMHACRPDVATCSFEGGADPVKGSKLSDSEWQQVVTDGTSLNSAYKRKLDQFVPYFQQLKSAGVPVLFRPLHELNEGWAWWGGRPGANGSARLFRITHDYLESKGLDNLLWVWNVKDTAANGGSGGVGNFYPGDDAVDVASLDPWVKGYPTGDWYQAMLNTAHGKPVALAEVGTVPTPAQLAAQPRWAWFMIWSEYLTTANSASGLQSTFNNSRVLSQGQFTLPSGGTNPPATPSGPLTGVGGKCVEVAGSGTANGTAVQLHGCNGSAAQKWAVASDGSLRALGKCLDVTGQGTANGTKLQLWECNGSGAQRWVAESDGHL
ncbi:glycosyl hydrolase, partial [Streptomyces sp. SID8380]|uniref:glycosyl hydrolase n=1 Tax=Streptomyces sp. SID8380 TaxID=2690360 RepID=UPI00136FBCC8